uniref:Beta-defensin-like domain-containing protein n=1 Tax=Pelusios castaneus TaxID=367368 RepID=A0A8C8RTH7_9SAUR
VEITILIYSPLHMEIKIFFFSAGFTQAQNFINCRRVGGSCRRGSCPGGSVRVGTCTGSDNCCV